MYTDMIHHGLTNYMERVCVVFRLNSEKCFASIPRILPFKSSDKAKKNYISTPN